MDSVRTRAQMTVIASVACWDRYSGQLASPGRRRIAAAVAADPAAVVAVDPAVADIAADRLAGSIHSTLVEGTLVADSLAVGMRHIADIAAAVVLVAVVAQLELADSEQPTRWRLRMFQVH